MTKNYKKGFTLIELLVVIAIIGILSSIVLASLNTARQKSRDARRQTDLQQVALALELIYDACGVYPTAATAGGTDLASTMQGCAGNTLDDHMSQVPTDPQGDAYVYYSQNGSTYCLGATVEDTTSIPDNTDTDCYGTAGDPFGVAGANYAISP